MFFGLVLLIFWMLFVFPENTVKSENALKILLKSLIAVKKTLLVLRRVNEEDSDEDDLLNLIFAVPSYGYEPYWDYSRDPHRPKQNNTADIENRLCVDECPREFHRRWICAVSGVGSIHKTFQSLCELNQANCPVKQWYIAYLAPCDDTEIPWDLTRANISDRAEQYAEEWLILHNLNTTTKPTTKVPTTRKRRKWLPFG